MGMGRNSSRLASRRYRPIFETLLSDYSFLVHHPLTGMTGISLSM
jgi:hypothetical protein